MGTLSSRKSNKASDARYAYFFAVTVPFVFHFHSTSFTFFSFPFVSFVVFLLSPACFFDASVKGDAAADMLVFFTATIVLIAVADEDELSLLAMKSMFSSL